MAFGLRCLDGVGEAYDAVINRQHTEDKYSMNLDAKNADQNANINFSSQNTMNMEQTNTNCCCNGSGMKWWKLGLAFVGGALFCHLLKLGEPKYDKPSKGKKNDKEGE